MLLPNELSWYKTDRSVRGSVIVAVDASMYCLLMKSLLDVTESTERYESEN